MKTGLLIAVMMMLWTPVFAADGAKTQSGPYVVTEDTVKDFLKLFRNARKGEKAVVVSLNNEAEAYIKGCCNNIGAVISLLKDSEFEIHITSDPEQLADLNRRLSRPGTYDHVIAGIKRRAGWWPFWDFFTRYNVVIPIKDGEVVWVSAWIVTDFI